MLRFRHVRAPMLVIALTLACVRSVTLQEQTANQFAPPPAPHERLFVALFGFGSELSSLYKDESERLLALCKVYESACFSQHFSEVRRRIAVLYTTPDDKRQIAGYVQAVLKVSDEQYAGLQVGLDIELSQNPGRPLPWVSVVDLGYSLHISGVRPRGDWLQLLNTPFPGGVWISAESPEFQALVMPITDEILNIASVVAVFPNGNRRRIPDGSFVIKRVSGTVVEFRAEVPSDFACEEPAKPPRVMPPTLRVQAAELFNADGSPRFSVKYQKGC